MNIDYRQMEYEALIDLLAEETTSSKMLLPVAESFFVVLLISPFKVCAGAWMVKIDKARMTVSCFICTANYLRWTFLFGKRKAFMKPAMY